MPKKEPQHAFFFAYSLTFWQGMITRVYEHERVDWAEAARRNARYPEPVGSRIA